MESGTRPTIENQRVIRQLEGRLKVAHERALELELLVGVDECALLDQSKRPRADLRDVNRWLNEALGLPY